MKYLIPILALIIGSVGGFLGGFQYYGGEITKKHAEESSSNVTDSQIIPIDSPLEESFSSGNYTHCVVYPGVGLVFSGVNENKELVVEQVLGTYPIDKLKEKGVSLRKGDLVSTPLEVIQGDYNSPLKISYRLFDDKTKKDREMLVTRKLVKKCFLKKAQSTGDSKDRPAY